MGILDIATRVLTEYRADIKDQKAKLQELQGEERKLAEEQLKASEARNTQLDAWKAKLEKVKFGFGTVTDIAGEAMTAARAFGDRLKLEAAAGAVNLQRLAASAGGAKTEMSLLADVAKVQAGAFQLNQTQLEMVQGAIRQLVRENNSVEEATKKVNEAILKLDGGGLKDFGISVRAAKSDGEKFAAIMDALGAKARLVDGDTVTVSESVSSMGVRFQDAFTKIRESIGQMVVAMGPLIEAAGELSITGAGFLGHIMKGWSFLVALGAENLNPFGGLDDAARKRVFLKMGGDPDDLRERADGAYENYLAQGGTPEGWISAMNDQLMARADNQSQMPASFEAGVGLLGKGFGALGKGGQFLAGKLEEATKRGKDAKAAAEKRKQEKEQFEQWMKGYLDRLQKDATDALVERLEAEIESEMLAGVSAGLLESLQRSPEFDAALNSAMEGERAKARERERQEKLTADWHKRIEAIQKAASNDNYAGAAIGRQQESQLSAIFGPLEEFDAYGRAFDTLKGAATSAFSAWIDGSASAAEAARKFVAEALRAVALDMLGQAIQHGAYALGALAYGNVASASAHGAAAAKFAAGAAAVGMLAKIAMPAAEKGSGASAPNTATGGGSPAPAQAPAIIVYGSEFSAESPRLRQQTAERMVAQAIAARDGRVAA